MDTTEQAVAQRQRYARANRWPEEIPPLTREEAERALRRLWKKFGNGEPISRRILRVWVPRKPPFNTIYRGWRRLVHDVSHRIFFRLHPGRRPHDPRHEWLEGEMVEFVLKSGWLDGKLKPKPKTEKPIRERRFQSVLERIEVWERKRKRAETALKKLRRQRAYYERQQIAA